MSMKMTVTINEVTQLDKGVWKVNVNPSELSIFGSPSNDVGGVSVLKVVNPDETVNTDGTLIFEPQNVRILNLGSSTEVLIISNTEVENTPTINTPTINKQSNPIIIGEGNRKFISDLSTVDQNLKTLGEEFLGEVRTCFSGDLKFDPGANKFVETPDNFWGVKIQSRDKSLRIVVRGLPDRFHDFDDVLDIKKDLTSYSTFKLTQLDQIPVVIKVLRRSKGLSE
jgi:hypothetical protein